MKIKNKEMRISEQVKEELGVPIDEISDIGTPCSPVLFRMGEHEERRAWELWEAMGWYLAREKEIPEYINYEYGHILSGWSEKRLGFFFERI